MTDTESGEDRRHQVERYRLLAREITDPATELEADALEKLADDSERCDQKMSRFVSWPAKRRPA